MEKPIAFASRTLSAADRNYSKIERETLRIIVGVKKFHQYLMGRPFPTRTDHRPLTKIYGPKTGIPSIAAARMQRWTLLLYGYQYNSEYIPSKENANADIFSRLLVDKHDYAIPNETAFVCMLTVNELPVTSEQIAEATCKETTLAKVYDHTLHGWPRSYARDDELYPFFVRKEELSLEDGRIVWDRIVVIPSIYTEHVLHELHTMHRRIVRMKSNARNSMWWPDI